MQPNPSFSLSVFKKAAMVFVGLLVATLLFLWLALPRIIHAQAEKFVAEKTGHRLTLDRPEFNPFELSLHLHKLQLSEADGKPLLAFDDFLVDVSAASLTRRAFVFDAIRLDGLAATVVELPGGLNWTPFLDALKSKEEKPDPEAGLPRLDIRSFVLTGGSLDYADRRSASGFSTRVEPLDLSLSELSTLPDDKGQFKISALTSFGARVLLQGELAINPVAVRGTLTLDDLQLAQLAPLLKGALPASPSGNLALSASYQVGNGGKQLDATIDAIAAKLTGLRLPLKQVDGPVAAIDSIELQGGRFELAKQVLTIGAIRVDGGKLELPQAGASPGFAALTLGNAQINLAERTATLEQVTLADGRLQATRNAQGQIDLLAAAKVFAVPAAAENAAAAQPAAPAWRYRLDKLDITGLGVALRDESVQPAAEFALENIVLSVTGVSDDLKAPLPLRLAFDARAGGHFEGEGTAVPADPAVDFKFKLADLALKPVQPYLSSRTTLVLADGKFSSQGRIAYSSKGPSYRGDFALRDLRLNEVATGNTLLAWKTLGSHALTLTAQQLDLGELRLNGLDTQLIIDKDKNVNLKNVIKTTTDASTSAPAPVGVTEPAIEPAATDKPFVVNIDRLRFSKGELDFADYSLALPFGTRIHGLRGSISNLSSRPGGIPGQLELDGEVDDYGMARAVGQVDLFNPTGFMDLRVVFRNVEMTRLTPYTVTFAGRKIDSGKLSLDLEYKIKQRQLQGENQIVMDRLTLGERVESPTAKDLPLDLAIAILQDSDGRIDLGLPVAGSLDDPEFSYGQIVWKAITNVLTKIVTAPFRALGALFGGGEKLEAIAFEAGAMQLTPPEREKLVRLAGALAKRPALVLAVGGVFAEADRVALQEVQLRRAVLVAAGQRVSEKGDPGPLSTQQPKVQAALETLFAERVGKSDLAALKEGFRRANPGQLEESTAGRMMSRLSGLLREKKTLSEDEVAQLKGGDFYAMLFERLQVREVVGDEKLQALGKARGEHAVEALKAAGVAAERLSLSAPEKGESSGRDVALKLALEAGKVSKQAE